MAAAPLNDEERQTPFQMGQLVVHPAYGFCRIAAIERAAMRDGLEDCYVFRMGSVGNPIKVLMPVARAEEAGLRRHMTRSQAEEVLRVFQLPATPLKPHSKEDLEEVACRLSSHDPRIVASTIRDLVTAGVKGWLGQPDGAFMNHQRSEQVMLTRALERLIEELAYVRQTSRKTIEEHIRKCLGRTRRRRAPQAIRS